MPRFLLVLILTAVVGYFAAQLLFRDQEEKVVETDQQTGKVYVDPNQLTNHPSASNNGPRPALTARRPEGPFVSNERLLRFRTDEAYQAALARLEQEKGARLLRAFPDLRAIQIGFRNRAELESALGEDGEALFNYMATIPLPPRPGSDPNAVPFNTSPLPYLGVTTDNISWGEGVTIAVLDSGIQDHVTFGDNIKPQVNIVPPPADGEQHPHGPAVTSPIAGQDPRLRGISPAATIQPVRIIDEQGTTNDAHILAGLNAAQTSGADIVVMALGGGSFNPLVAEKIQTLHQQGIAVVVSSGNEGLTTPSYPSRYEGAYAIGAIDSNGRVANFSNSGETLDFVAPGVGVPTAYGDDLVATSSGTSFAAPLFAGAVAAIQSGSGLNAVQVIEQEIRPYLNDVGAPGPDLESGQGVPNMARIFRRDEPSVVDVAVTANHFHTDDSRSGHNDLTPGLHVVVENQGTTTSPPAELMSQIGTSQFTHQVPGMRPGEERSFFIPGATGPEFTGEGRLPSVTSGVRLRDPGADQTPGNNRLRTAFPVPVAPESSSFQSNASESSAE